MAMGYKSGQMVHSTKVSGIKAKWMDKEYYYIAMEIFMKVNSFKVMPVGMENTQEALN